MLVRIVRNYDYPDYFRQTPGRKHTWDGIEFTFEDVSECDFLIVLNSTRKDINVVCPKGNKWLFSQEPPIEMYRWHTTIFKHFDKVFTFWDKTVDSNIISDQTCLPWHLNKDYDFLKALQSEQVNKKDEVSWITSNAAHKPGHKVRMSLKDHLEDTNFHFDLFGRGFQPIEDKFDGIAPYKYSIAVENFQCNDYWTEKISDCFLSWAMPFYFGCKNILNYFPEEAITFIDADDPPRAVAQMQEAMQNKAWEKNIKAIGKARELILEEYQLFPSLVKKIKANNQSSEKEAHFIPANIPPSEQKALSFKIKKIFNKYF